MKSLLLTEQNFKATVAKIKTQTMRVGGLEFLNMHYENMNDPQIEFLGMETDPEIVDANSIEGDPVTWKGIYPRFFTGNISEYDEMYFKPRFQPGDIVYLKEPFAIKHPSDEPPGGNVAYLYGTSHTKADFKFKSKLFMPEKHARYFVKITNIGVKRVQHITTDELKAEGCAGTIGYGPLWYDNWRELWNSINRKWTFLKGWDASFIYPFSDEDAFELPKRPAKHRDKAFHICANPWCFVYKYELIDKKLN